jgi:hypothetical protein
MSQLPNGKQTKVRRLAMDAYSLALAIFNTPWVRGIMGLIAANVLLGIACALFSKQYQFYLGAVGDFLLTRIMPYVIGWAAVKMLALTALVDYREAAMALETAVSALVIAALLGKIADQLRVLGLPIPAWSGSSPRPEATLKP